MEMIKKLLQKIKSLTFTIFKLLLFFIFSLLFMELVIHLFALGQSGYDSYNMFLKSLSGKIPRKSSEKVLFFVGDSTVAGEGASVINKYSLPAQLQNMLNKVSPDFKIYNLGFPSTSTSEHLRILEMLPEGVNVFYRGGLIDPVSQNLNFRFCIMGQYFEIRTLKMLSLLIPRIFITEGLNNDHSQKITARLQKIIERKKLKIFTLDYTTVIPFSDMHSGKPVIPLYTEDFGITRINLRAMAKEAGFTGKKNILNTRFISNKTGIHPNDAGYYIEALILFNYFCHVNLFGLTPENKTDLKTVDIFENELESRYYRIKKELYEKTEDDLLQNPFQISSILSELIHLAEILRTRNPDSEKYIKEHEMLEKLVFFVVHEARIINHFLSNPQNRWSNDPVKEKIAVAVFYAIVIPQLMDNTDYGSNVLQKLNSSKYSNYEEQMSPLFGISPYPLQFCERFIKESGIKAEDLNLNKEWEYFFSFPIETFLNINNPRVRALCRHQ
jgi:hypothetical protein